MAHRELSPDDPRDIGPYHLIGRLDAGDLGQEYLARAPGGQLVAVQVLAADLASSPENRALFAQGVAGATRVAGEFTARVISADLEAPRPWVARVYEEGPTLDSVVRRYGPLPGPLLLALGAALAEGLREVHAAGVVHRDLKPSNVILGDDGPRIVDFGIALVLTEPTGVASHDAIVGTPGYMSPEQVRGESVGTPSDIFSLGVVLTVAATERGPFQAESVIASLYRTVETEPDLAGVPELIRPLVTECLAKNPAERPSASAVEASCYQLAARVFGLNGETLRGLMGALGGWHGTEATRSAYPAGPVGSASPATPPRPAAPPSPAAPSPPPPSPAAPPQPQPQYQEAPELLAPPEPPAGPYREYIDGGDWVPAPAQGSQPQAAPSPAEQPPVFRFLTGILPDRAPVGARLSLLVLVTLRRGAGPSAMLENLPVPPGGTVLTITVSAPGLIPLGDLEQDLFVPHDADSTPIRFGFLTGPSGLHSAVIRAFSGGTFLGELTLQISVEPGALLEEGRDKTAVLGGLAAEPGEVTLQVSRTDEDRYSFQLIGEAWNQAVVTRRLAGDPTQVVGALIDELRAMSANESRFSSPALVRNRIKNLGAALWAEVVPEVIRNQFWAQGDKIKLFTIASDMDTVPWELLYPVDGANDNGFLVEQFPVVRRVYGQGRTRVLRLDSGAAYIVPPGSPANAMSEVEGVRGIFPGHVRNRGVCASLAGFTELLEAAPSVLHFACHNAFTEQAGSVITLDGGPLRPTDLAVAVQKKGLAAISPVVFLNACRTAGDVRGLMQLMGWARQFMGAGAGAFIGSLWAVRSSSAKTFAEAFYRAMISDGLPLGAASLRARQAIADDPGDPTWLAYTVYGNPAARIDAG